MGLPIQIDEVNGMVQLHQKFAEQNKKTLWWTASDPESDV